MLFFCAIALCPKENGVTNAELPEVEPYPGELPKIKSAFERLSREFANTQMTPSSQRLFEMTASNLFGEAGFEVHVEWRDLFSKEGENLGVTQPLVTLTGRVKKEEEVDHDRLKWEIRAGMVDGVKGVIDVNSGELKEEPSKKLII